MSRSEETWRELEAELRLARLSAADRSLELREVAAAQSVFYCAAESLARIHLLEIVSED